jgi:hypothetical protein
MTDSTVAHLPCFDTDPSIDDEVRAAFTERVRAEVARLLADSLAARSVSADAAGAHGAALRLRNEAHAHECEAHRHEQRAAMLRQLAHDGRL